MSNLEVVNVVGSGALGIELDLERLATDIGEPNAKYDPDKYPGMYLRFNGDSPLVTLYRTGKYIITGADSKQTVYDQREEFLSLLADMNVLEGPTDTTFSMQNFVCSGDLDSDLNLNALAIGLGLENTEYEPEQFPGLVYRPSEADSVILLFGSGRVVITGSPDLDAAKADFQIVQNEVADVLNID